MSVPPSVSIVIPIWNAEEYLPELLTNVLRQEGVTVEEIILLDSHSTDNSVKIGKSFAKVQIHPEGNFSHGGTRNRGIGLAKTEIVVLLSQDALPSSPQCLLPLVKALEAPRTAYAFSRQIPYPKTNPIERGHIEHAFPETPSIYQLGEDESITQPEQIFCSNVCSAIKKSVWNSIPFREHLIMGEDQQLSKELQEQGYHVAYVPESVVLHSHNYSLSQSFKRYFDSVVALDQILDGRDISGSSLRGVAFLKTEVRSLLKHHPVWLPYYLLFLVTRRAATLLAHRARNLPTGFCRKFSMHPAYWQS